MFRRGGFVKTLKKKRVKVAQFCRYFEAAKFAGGRPKFVWSFALSYGVL